MKARGIKHPHGSRCLKILSNCTRLSGAQVILREISNITRSLNP